MAMKKTRSRRKTAKGANPLTRIKSYDKSKSKARPRRMESGMTVRG